MKVLLRTHIARLWQALARGVIAFLLLAWAPFVRASDIEDELGGFEEDQEFAADVEIDREAPAAPERGWDVDGSVALSSSINYLPHESTDGADWTGLSRLRTRLNLEFDFELPGAWKARLSPYAWYDFAYLIRGMGKFTQDVIDTYEWEWDFQDSYLEGALLENLDLKIGRQVVNWGRSDTLRVLDVLNPLDNREPARADIEDLRWSVGMAKLDWHIHRRWTLTGVAIPEIRVDTLPPYGSDFTLLDPRDIPFELAPGFDFRLPPEVVPDSFESWEWAASLMGIFEGWDLSLHFAYFFDNLPRLEPLSTAPILWQVLEGDLLQVYDRLLMVGASGNYTFGAWLLKAEVAWLDGFRFAFLTPGVGDFFVDSLALTDQKSRLDVMGGVEYYGFTDTTIALEVVNRHVFGLEGLARGFPTFQRENEVEYAIRYTADWMNARLRTTILAVIFGWKAQDGAIIRLQADYTILDALVATAGILLYQGGELPPLGNWGRNDRVFIELKYSF